MWYVGNSFLVRAVFWNVTPVFFNIFSLPQSSRGNYVSKILGYSIRASIKHVWVSWARRQHHRWRSESAPPQVQEGAPFEIPDKWLSRSLAFVG